MDTITAWTRGFRSKLLLLMVIPLFMLAGLVVGGTWSITQMGADIDVLADQRIPITQAYGDMRTSLHAAARFLWVAYAKENDFSERKKAIEEVRSRVTAFEEALTSFQSFKVSQKTQEAFAQVPEAWKTYRGFVEEAIGMLEMNDRGMDALIKHNLPSKLMGPAKIIGDALRNADNISDEITREIVKAAHARAAWSRNMAIFTGIAGIALVMIFGFSLGSSTANSLERIVDDLAESGTQLGTVSSQLSGSSQQLSSGATESAASLEETVSSLEELTAMVKQNADNAKEAASLSATSRTSAESGEGRMKTLQDSMTEIAASSKKIEEIINVIDDIAFQTNLLALNAAVEAARAGEQGKGFAVVADAVRGLAQRSAAAAKDITTLIKDGVSKTDNGVKIADESGRVLKEIVSSVKKTADLINEIASASREQSNGLVEVSKAMNQLDQVTQSNAASAEEVAASSGEMSSQASAVQDMVLKLKRIVTGDCSGTAHASLHAPAAGRVKA